jgi:adenine-specific DNA-methyltransferase
LSGDREELERHALSLREALRGLLQYDRSDLDFGIYRILNKRREEIDHFLEESLLEAIEGAISAAGIEADERDGLAARLCADLARFFERYYDSGDFLPLRRYRTGTYSIPYEGEEVLMHWANRDQYYIKSDEQLSNYSFALAGDKVVRFSVVPPDEEDSGPAPDSQRLYALADPPVLTEGSDSVIVRWNFVEKKKGVKQADLSAAACEALLDGELLEEEWRLALRSPPTVGEQRSLLARHVDTFTARNSYDYFVHRDLGGFLRTELEAFLKADLVRLDEQNDRSSLERNLARLAAARAAAIPVIEFLAQVEDFQKRLWLKRKLVLEADWLLTLDRLAPELLPEVAGCTAQHEAWARDLDVESIEGWTSPPSLEFLQAHPELVLDTAHFDRAFTRRLLAAVPDIDEATIGWAVNGDCFQALRFLQPRFEGQVGASYIDPPYNTGGGDFLYKDRYPHSSWLSMIHDRAALGRSLLTEDGVQVASIDDDEQPRLRLALDEVFGAENFVANVIWQKKYSPANDATWFSDDHDHLLFYARSKAIWRPARLPRTAEADKSYKNPDKDSRGPWMSGDYTQSKTKEERPNGWYAIRRPADGAEIWPSASGVWRFTAEEHQANVADDRVWWGKDGLNQMPRFKRFLSEVGGLVPRTVWPHQDAGHNQDAVRDLQALFRQNPFRNPKPLKLLRRILSICQGDLVLDYFAGSGTLGHAVIDERREGAGRRRFILAEQGAHFETVLRPRLTKALHAGKWKEGRPERRDFVSGMVQVLRLESYEDALDSVELVRTEQQASLLESADGVARDYFMRYLLPTEGRERLRDPKLFREPFAVRSTATLDGIRAEASPDLPETFNWLLGLRPARVSSEAGLLGVRGVDRLGRETLVVWRDHEAVDEETFEKWFEALSPELRDEQLGVVYVNGDTDLERRRRDGESWTVRLTEDAFLELMFDELDAP